MESEALVGLAGAGIVLGLVSALKQALAIPGRMTPLIAIVIGMGWNVGVQQAGVQDVAEDSSIGAAVVLGILSGLAASGLYSGGRAVLNGPTAEE